MNQPKTCNHWSSTTEHWQCVRPEGHEGDHSPALEAEGNHKFVAIGNGIMLGKHLCVGTARSRTMALRIVKALNQHRTNRRGV